MIAIGLIHWNEKVKSAKLWKRIAVGCLCVIIGYVAGLITMVDFYHAGILTVLVFYFFRHRKWWCYAGQLLCLWYINVEMLGGFALLALIPIRLYRGNRGIIAKY